MTPDTQALNGFPTGLAELAAGLKSGKIDLLDHLDNLENRFNRLEPQVMAFMDEDGAGPWGGRFERLRDQARKLLNRFPAPDKRPPLFGVPVGVKDIFRADGFATRAGSKLPPGVLAGPQARAVDQLLEAGALVLGKTVTTEFAYFAPGPTTNPCAPGHTPGGSSSGSAAAVAAGLASLALGSQTVGSVNRPASFCGVYGFKPGRGRMSIEGAIPYSPAMDQAGFFCAAPKDADLAARVLCPDWRGLDMQERVPGTLGVVTGRYMEYVQPGTRDAFQAVLDRLSQAGWRIVQTAAMPDFDDVARRHNVFIAAEAARVHARWFADFGHLYHPVTAALLERGAKVPDWQVNDLSGSGIELRTRLDEIMEQQGIEAFISPASTGPAPAGLDSTGDPIMNLPWTHAGMPSCSIPGAMLHHKLPVGLQLAGRHGEDETLLNASISMHAILSLDAP